MKVFLEIFGGDEIISDSFEISEVFNGAGGEVKSRLIVKGEVEIDIGRLFIIFLFFFSFLNHSIPIGRGNQFGGADPEEEVVDPNVEKVNNIIDAFQYRETSFTKASFQNWIKGYMKKLKDHLDANNKDRVEGFMKGAKEMVGFVLQRFDDFQL